MAVAFLRQMRPLLQYFLCGSLSHSGTSFKDHIRNEERGVPVFPAAPWVSRVGELGYRIRMRRLEKGWTQRDLAVHSGVVHSHLSKIERGLCRPHVHTLMELERVLEISLCPFAPQKNEKAKIAKKVVLAGTNRDEALASAELSDLAG